MSGNSLPRAFGDFYLYFPRCPKCGEEPDVRWIGAAITASARCGRPPHPRGEHFDLTCSRCAHVWAYEAAS